jgi:hypothetical protein
MNMNENNENQIENLLTTEEFTSIVRSARSSAQKAMLQREFARVPAQPSALKKIAADAGTWFQSLLFRPGAAYAAASTEPMEAYSVGKSGTDHSIFLVAGGDESWKLDLHEFEPYLRVSIECPNEPDGGEFGIWVSAGTGVHELKGVVRNGELVRVQEIEYKKRSETEPTTLSSIEISSKEDVETIYQANKVLAVVAVYRIES